MDLSINAINLAFIYFANKVGGKTIFINPPGGERAMVKPDKPKSKADESQLL
jgi:hypothetical protein